jgi:hypothetical protein
MISFSAIKALVSEEAMNYAKTTAYLIRSFHQALFSMYARSEPLKFFKNEGEARAWLGSFR